MNVQNLIEEAGSLDEAIGKFIEKIQTGQISFPYQKFFLDPPMEMYLRLRKSVPKIIHRKNRIRAYYPFRNAVDCYFYGKPVAVLSDNDTYLSYDGISDHFCENIRIKARRCDSISPYEFWKDANKMSDVLIESFKYETITARNLRNTIYDRVKEAKQFRPSWVKGVIKLIFNRYDNLKMLDISAGWGDRLIAAISMGMEYLGFDPNSALNSGHSRMIEMFGEKKLQKVVYRPFEDPGYVLRENYYDICLSSPPFFDLERYSEDSTQSCVKYDQIRTWMEGFLFPAMKRAWSALKEGGFLAIHLGDTFRFRICDPMNHYIDEFLPHSIYKGVIGIVGERRRPTPVWIWQKNPMFSTFKRPLFPYKFSTMFDEYSDPDQARMVLKSRDEESVEI